MEEILADVLYRYAADSDGGENRDILKIFKNNMRIDFSLTDYVKTLEAFVTQAVLRIDGDFKHYQEEYAKHVNEVKDLKLALHLSKGDEKALRETSATKDETIKLLIADVAKSQDERDKLDKELDETCKCLEHHQKESEEMEKYYIDEIVENDECIETLCDDIEALSDELDSDCNINEKLKNALLVWIEKHQAKSRGLEALSVKYEGNKDHLVRLEKNHADLKREHEVWGKEMDSLEERARNSYDEMRYWQEMAGRNIDMPEELASVKKDRDAWKARAEKLKADCEKMAVELKEYRDFESLASQRCPTLGCFGGADVRYSITGERRLYWPHTTIEKCHPPKVMIADSAHGIFFVGETLEEAKVHNKVGTSLEQRKKIVAERASAEMCVDSPFYDLDDPFDREYKDDKLGAPYHEDEDKLRDRIEKQFEDVFLITPIAQKLETPEGRSEVANLICKIPMQPLCGLGQTGITTEISIPMTAADWDKLCNPHKLDLIKENLEKAEARKIASEGSKFTSLFFDHPFVPVDAGVQYTCEAWGALNMGPFLQHLKMSD